MRRVLVLAWILVAGVAATALGQQPPDPALRSKEPAERLRALRGLHRAQLDPATVAAVGRMAREEPHPQVRAEALTRLGEWVGRDAAEQGSAGAVEILGAALTAESSWVRCGAGSGLAAAGPAAAGARTTLLAVIDDPARFDVHPAALLALGNLPDLDGAEIELIAGLLTDDDPVIVGCAARALGRQGAAALAAAERIADVYPADAQPGPRVPELPPDDGGIVVSWLDLRGSVFGAAQRNIIFEGVGVMLAFAERDGRRFVRVVTSSYNGPPPPPPPGGAAPDADRERETREHESLGWRVAYHDIVVRSEPGDLPANDLLFVELVGAVDRAPWRFREQGRRLELPNPSAWDGSPAAYRRSSMRALRGEAFDLAEAALWRICGDPEVSAARDVVARLLVHPSGRIRTLALRMLTARPASAGSASVLLDLAAHGDRHQAALAAEAFRSIPEGAGEALREAVLSDDEGMRSKALSLARSMGAQAEPVAVVLARWLRDGGPLSDSEILRAIGGLGAHGAPAIGALIERVSTKGRHHEEALRVLGGMGPVASDALPIMLRVARTRPGFGHGRLAAVQALASIAPDHPELPGFIVALCTDPNDNVVEHTLLWVYAMGSPPDGIVEAVLELVTREQWMTRRTAATALGRLGKGRKDVSVVLAAMLDDEHPWVQVVAAESLDQVDPGHPRVVPVLRRLLRDEDWNHRWHATMALEHMGPRARAALPDLRRHAADPDEHGHVRRGASKAIAAIEAGD